MKSLTELFESHNEKIVFKWTHYLDLYERYLSSFRNKSISILEIGVLNGGSLQLWKKYFGKNCNIVGIDINPNFKYEEPQIKVEIGDQTDRKFLKYIVDTYGPFDIIIDDGSHIQNHIKTSFDFLYDYVKDDGVYVIEDTHTAYMKSYNGGLKSPLNIIHHISKFVDDIHFRYIKDFFYVKKIKNIKSISFYDSIIFIEKENEENTNRLVKMIGKDFYKETNNDTMFK